MFSLGTMIWFFLFLCVIGWLVYLIFFDDRPLTTEKRERALKELEDSLDSRNRNVENDEWENSGFTREEIEYDYLQRMQEQQDEEDEYLSRMNEE